VVLKYGNIENFNFYNYLPQVLVSFPWPIGVAALRICTGGLRPILLAGRGFSNGAGCCERGKWVPSVPFPSETEVDRVRRADYASPSRCGIATESALRGIGAMLLVIDNYDSFTYNLVQYFGELGVEMEVHRNDRITLDEIREKRPDRLCVSPGPCTPREAGISCEVIREFGPDIPLFGVCLGHQCLGEVYGGEVVRAPRLMHGKTSPILHGGEGLFAGLPSPFEATRYHSLIVRRETLPDCLEITAETAEGEIMGLRHREHPVWGVQFHPESILTEHGKQILKNFLGLEAPR